MKLSTKIVCAIPVLGAFAGPLLPGINRASLWLGMPRLMLWTLGCSVVGTTAALLFSEWMRTAEDEEELQ